MKRLVLCILLAVANHSNAEVLVIFGSELSLNADCTLSVTQSDGESQQLRLFEEEASKNCLFVTHAETNIPHAEQIGNSYVLLVETSPDRGGNCIAKYMAIVVTQEGNVIPSAKTKTSGTCRIGRERKVFEYFAHDMQILK